MGGAKAPSDRLLEMEPECLSVLRERAKPRLLGDIEIPVPPYHESLGGHHCSMGGRHAEHALEAGQALKVLQVAYEKVRKEVIIGASIYLGMGQQGFDFAGKQKRIPDACVVERPDP